MSGTLVKKFKESRCISFLCFFLAAAFFLPVFFLSSCSGNNFNIKNIARNFPDAPAEIEEASICKNVDSNFSPLEKTSDFPGDTNSVYLSVKFKNLSENDMLKVVWTFSTTGKQLSTQQFKPESKSSGFYSFNIKTSTAFPPGDYLAEVYLDNIIVQSLSFSVSSQ
jgi:hypothetical protein